MNEKIAKVITNRLREFSDLLGEYYSLPPRTADIIVQRRQAFIRLENAANDNLTRHTGWGEILAPASDENIYDAYTYLILCEELAETFGVPISFPMALKLSVSTEPARMYVHNSGVRNLVVHPRPMPKALGEIADALGIEIPPQNDAGCRSTPALCRVAWEGAEHGYWETEDVLTLPQPLVPFTPEMLEMIENSHMVTAGEVDLYLA